MSGEWWKEMEADPEMEPWCQRCGAAIRFGHMHLVALRKGGAALDGVVGFRLRGPFVLCDDCWPIFTACAGESCLTLERHAGGLLGGGA